MQNQVKVPKEIQELFIEAEACRELAKAHTNWLIPSPKALYYTIRSQKVLSLAWRTLERVFPQVVDGWSYNNKTGLAVAPDAPVELKPKKPRAPRKPKAAPVEAEVGK